MCPRRHPRPPRPPPQHPRETKRLRDEGQLNVINAHVPFGDATEPYLQALAEAYRQMAMLAPTIVIGDMNAAPTARQTSW